MTASDGDEPMSLDAYYQDLRAAAGLNTAPGAADAFLVDPEGKSVRELADELAASASADLSTADRNLAGSL